MYQNIFKESDSNHKFLRFPYLQDKNFEVLRSSTALDKVGLDSAGTVRAKPTVKYSGFITYSNTINFASKWSDKSGYLIT